jgi:hypothetical protein
MRVDATEKTPPFGKRGAGDIWCDFSRCHMLHFFNELYFQDVAMEWPNRSSRSTRLERFERLEPLERAGRNPSMC